MKKQIKNPIRPANLSTVTRLETARATKIGRMAETNFMPILMKNVVQVFEA